MSSVGVQIEQVERHLSEMRKHAEAFTEYVDFVYSRSDKSKLDELAVMRRFDPKTLMRQQVFYVPKSAAALMVPKFQERLHSFGILTVRNTPVFYGRWIFPIRNRYGQVVNLVGYSNTANIRYIYGRAEFFDRRNTLFGLENLSAVSELGYAVITEGITDAIRLRDAGYSNAFAMCGTHSSSFIEGQINRRSERGVICIPDRDAPGQKALKGWNFTNRRVIWTDPAYKDIDEQCREHPESVNILRRAISMTVENLGTGALSGGGEAITLRVKIAQNT